MKLRLLVMVWLLTSMANAVELKIQQGSSAVTKLLMAYGFTSAAHTQGHFDEAEQIGIDIKLDIRNLVELYHPRNKNEQARMAGAGYRMQDKMIRAFDGTSLQRQMRLANAAYKAAYLSGMATAFASGISEGGDIGEFDRSKGRNFNREALTITALFDLYKAYGGKSGWNIGYWQDHTTGTPGLEIIGSW